MLSLRTSRSSRVLPRLSSLITRTEWPYLCVPICHCCLSGYHSPVDPAPLLSPSHTHWLYLAPIQIICPIFGPPISADCAKSCIDVLHQAPSPSYRHFVGRHPIASQRPGDQRIELERFLRSLLTTSNGSSFHTNSLPDHFALLYCVYLCAWLCEDFDCQLSIICLEHCYLPTLLTAIGRRVVEKMVIDSTFTFQHASRMLCTGT